MRFNLFLQMRKLKFEEVKKLAELHSIMAEPGLVSQCYVTPKHSTLNHHATCQSQVSLKPSFWYPSLHFGLQVGKPLFAGHLIIHNYAPMLLPSR